MLGEYLTGLPRPPSANDEQRGLFWQDEAGGSHIMTMNTPNSPEPDHIWPGWCINEPSLNLPCIDPTSERVAAARSRHPGGVNVVMADGSTQWVSDNIALTVWQALGSIDGRRGVSEPVLNDGTRRQAETIRMRFDDDLCVRQFSCWRSFRCDAARLRRAGQSGGGQRNRALQRPAGCHRLDLLRAHGGKRRPLVRRP